MEDRLVWLLKYFELKARVVHAGHLPTVAGFNASGGLGYIHVLKRGKLLLKEAGGSSRLLEEPTLFFYMNPVTHSLVPKSDDVAIYCAAFEFGNELKNPIIKALPELVLLKLKEIPSLIDSLNILFKEADEDHCGRQAILDRLIETVIILVLRDLMDENRLEIGLLAGLADLKLSRAINAMHAEPAKSWSLEELAQTAGMSRARFAVRFREVVGITPVQYLSEWRIGLAQSLLSRGKSLEFVADAVGYSNASAFSRAFTALVGIPPSSWKKQQQL